MSLNKSKLIVLQELVHHAQNFLSHRKSQKQWSSTVNMFNIFKDYVPINTLLQTHHDGVTSVQLKSLKCIN